MNNATEPRIEPMSSVFGYTDPYRMDMVRQRYGHYADIACNTSIPWTFNTPTPALTITLWRGLIAPTGMMMLAGLKSSVKVRMPPEQLLGAIDAYLTAYLHQYIPGPLPEPLYEPYQRAACHAGRIRLPATDLALAKEMVSIMVAEFKADGFCDDLPYSVVAPIETMVKYNPNLSPPAQTPANALLYNFNPKFYLAMP